MGQTETALAVINQSPALLDQVSESTRQNIRASKAESTIRRYKKAWAHFAAWCDRRGASAIPADVPAVADYISDLKDEGNGKKYATIQLHIAAISKAHALAGFTSPTHHPLVKDALAGIARQIGRTQDRKHAAEKEHIWQMLQALDDNEPCDIRDRALLLIGFNGALRRSELVALNVEDMEPQGKGLMIHIRRSKTDQEGKGHEVAIPAGRTEPTCSSLALRKWLDYAKIESGAVFRRIDKGGHVHERLTPQSVALIIKKRCKAAKLDPRLYSGHSLRAGLATSAALAGASADSIRRTTRHESAAILSKYIRVADMWRDNAAEKVGL